MIIGCSLFSQAKDVVKLPLLSDRLSTNIRPRMPAANPLPVCVYADGILTVTFRSPEGEAGVVITHADYTEEYTVSTESPIVIYTDIIVGDTVEINTEEGNCYVAVCED